MASSPIQRLRAVALNSRSRVTITPIPGLTPYVVSLRGSMLIYHEQDTQWTSPL